MNATLPHSAGSALLKTHNATLPHSAGSALLETHNATLPHSAGPALLETHNATGSATDAVQGSVLPAVEFSWGGYFEAIGVMLILLGALWGILWLMRRYGRFRFMPAPGAFPRNGLAVEAQLPLGPRKGLFVVRFLNERLLLGVTDQQITLIKELYSPDDADDLGPVNPTDAKAFARLLAKEGGPDHASAKKE